MQFLYTNLPPLKTRNQPFYDAFYSLMTQAIRMDIAVGYITADSLVELKQIAAHYHKIETLNLIIGMHRWDKFTRIEYKAAIALNEFLREGNRGEVRLVIPFRFHGKLYSYSDADGAFAGIVGSNNLASIVNTQTRPYEVSLLIQEQPCASEMRTFIERLSTEATKNIADVVITDFKEYNPLLENHENVDPVDPAELADVVSSLTSTSFEIPLVKNGDVPLKSNLNVFFGAGRRVATKGIMQMRHWYEVELIVPSSITQQPGYPQKDTESAVFTVVTDDQWKFFCKVSGDSSKNLRSKDDLRILGKWIKGRLEIAGALEIGDPVTSETLARYGRDTFTFTQTTTPNLWYLNFGV